MKNWILIVSVLLIGAFMAGFFPQYAKANRLKNELQEARQENTLAELRDLAALAYLQASQKNYGLAAGTSTRFFNRTRAVANQTPASGARGPLVDLMGFRDKITAGLAKGEPEAVNDLQALVLRTREATATSTGAAKPE